MSTINTYAVRVGPSFSSALWVTGLLLRLGMVTLFVALLVFKPGAAWPFFMLIIVDLFVLCFQVVRFSNAASIFLQETGRFWTVTLASMGVVTAALVTLFLWWLAFLAMDELLTKSGSSRPIHKSQHNSVAVMENRAPPRRFRVHLSLDGRILTYDGIMASGMMSELEPIFADARDLEQITLNSPGGNLNEARNLAQRVLQRGLDTHVLQDCSASCLLAFTAGANRTMGTGAKLGFHRYGLDFKQLMPFVEVNVEQLQDQAFFEQQAVDRNFIDRYFMQERRALWYPHKNELFNAGIITQK